MAVADLSYFPFSFSSPFPHLPSSTVRIARLGKKLQIEFWSPSLQSQGRTKPYPQGDADLGFLRSFKQCVRYISQALNILSWKLPPKHKPENQDDKPYSESNFAQNQLEYFTEEKELSPSLGLTLEGRTAETKAHTNYFQLHILPLEFAFLNTA